MSNDEVRWCDNEKKNDSIDSTTSNNVNAASYTFRSVYHINNNNIVHDEDDDESNKDDDQISVINIHKHRNIHIKRDSRNNYNFYDDYDNSTDSTTRSTCQHHHSHQQHDQHQKHSSTYSRNYYQIVNVCFIIMLHVLCNFLVTSVNCDELMESVGARGHFTHTWAVHIPGGEDVAKLVADDHGMILRGRIIDDHYHMEHRSIAKRSISPSHHHQRRLNEDNRVVWSKQQTAKSRQKRDFTRLKPKSISKLLNDPKWSSMWYLNRGDGLDMNVVPAWREGITGKGVVVTILDDGLETDHPDLERNYDPEASWDVNSHDADPMPHYDMTDSNRHGTRCAGEVAATANNSLCAVGIAYSARVGGVRMLDGDVTDSVEAMSLGLNPQHIDIYSASWGPDDDGKTVDGPGEMATKAFIDGVTKGRDGKGSIFVWASGNGGREQDNCNCDGYTNSIWTLSISSATEYGDIPWYSEKCSSTLATTYSSGQQNEKQVVTTDLHHMCTSSHTGTSASAPLAAGIVALALEANPNLTWRDMQHIVVRTANPANLGKSSNEWTVNGVGRKVSHSFGYGLMDAAAMVRLARVWETVPEQQRCEIHSPHLDKPIPPKRNVTFTLKVDHCKGVNFLEHVQARITLTTQRRGDIVIYLTSPSGTRTCLLTERVHDISRSGFGDWPFMTVHQWGEAPHGTWELEIHNKGRYMEFALLRYWTLVLYGTAISAQRGDDDVSQSSSNSQLLNSNSSLNNNSNSSTNYRLKPQNNSNNNNNSGSTANRKTSSQQKSSTQSPQATTITRKNGKQKNSNKNGKSNQKITSSTTTTTVRPLYTTVMLNQFSISTQMGKNKTKVNQNASTIVPRPRPTAKLPNTKSNSNANNNNNNNNNNLLSSSKMDKYQPSYSNIYEKSSGKAPKQVKENSYTTPRLSEGPTPNPSMSRMFEQYEKIEEIFPEFEPYKEVNPVFFTVSNGKPSRENSKSFSSFVSFDSVPQKKNTPIDDPSETRQKIISSSTTSTQGTSNGKGQITQWNLIFYGTSDPPQRNDPPRYPSGNNKKTVNDFIHNSLENSQWGFITQDVAEMGSHSDVQRTVDDDLTSSACLHYSDNNKSFCLECAHQTFIFDGRCYNTCPERSFIVPEKVSENIESKGLSVKKRRHAMNIDEFDSLDDIIGKTNREISSSESSITPQKLCGSCHDVCLKCNGPTENDCLTCDSDYNQIIIGSRIICHRKSNDDENINSSSTTTTIATEIVNDGNKSVLNSITNQLKNYSIEKIVLISSMIGILLMIISICIYLLFIKCDCDILSTVYGKTKQLLCKASSGKSTGVERVKYSYNIVEMEERSPLTTILPDSQILHNVYHDDDDDDDEHSDISES